MKTILRSLILLIGLAVSAHAESVTFKQGADVLSTDGLVDITAYAGTEDTSMVQESSTNNYGGRSTILVGVLGSGRVRTGLIRYDLSSMAGIYQSIDSMTLRLYVDAMAGSQVMGVGLEREGNANWVEGTTNGANQVGSSNWRYAQHDTVNWLGGQNGARGASDLYGTVASVTLNNTVAGAGTWVDITIDPSGLDASVDTLTEIVDLWNGTGNAGIHMTYGSQVSNPQWQFASSETATAGHEPELVIEYTAANSGSLVRPGTINLTTLALGDAETSILRPGLDLVTVTDSDGFSVGTAPGDIHTITLERTIGLVPGTYPVIAYTGTIGGAGFDGLSLDTPPHVTATLVNNSGTIDIDVTAIDTLVWDGDAGTADWDESTLNFKIAGGSQDEAYFPGDDVIFDDTATNGGSVNVAAEVSPSSLVFDHDTLTYTLAGAAVSGDTELEKLGAGTLTLLNDNTYTGGTWLDDGRLILGDGTTGSLDGTQVTVASPATLEVNAPDGNHGLAIETNGAVEFSGINTVTRTTAISGSGTVAYTGSGTLVLNSANTFTGGLQVMSGTVAATGNNAKNRLPNDSTVTVESGGTFDVRNTNALPTLETGRIPVSVVLNGGTLTASTGGHNHTNLLDLTLNDGAALTTEADVNVYNGENFRLNGNLTVGGTSASTITCLDGVGLGSVATYETHVFDIPDVTLDSAADLTIDCAFVGGGASVLRKQGDGTVTLNASSPTFSGTTTIAEGILELGEFGSLEACARIEVQAGATYDVSALTTFHEIGLSQTLAGNGTVDGSANLFGTIDPGASVGTLTITGELVIEADSAITTELGDWSVPEADLIVAGSVNVASDSFGPAVITIDGSLISNFSETSTTITLVQTTSGITGFAANAFDIQTTNFAGLGSWEIQHNSNKLDLVYTAGTDPYLLWGASKGLTGSNNGFDVDAEGDGVDNGLEWILGGDPLAQDAAAILPAAEGAAGSGLTLDFTREEGSIGQATLTVEWDTALDGGFAHSIVVEEFSSNDPGTGVTVTIDNGTTPDDVTVNIPATNAPDGKIFARLKAEQ